MTREISDLQKKRAYNLIWNAAADYGFLPDFKFYTRDGIADVYWNSLFGLARKHYDYPQLSKLFPRGRGGGVRGPALARPGKRPRREGEGRAPCPRPAPAALCRVVPERIRRRPYRGRPLLRLSRRGPLPASPRPAAEGLPLRSDAPGRAGVLSRPGHRGARRGDAAPSPEVVPDPRP